VTREEARLELDATTLRPQDASEEAREMGASDAELSAWLKQRTSFDKEVSETLVATIPPGLRGRLLMAKAQSAKPRMRWLKPSLLTAAAACIAVGWTFLWPLSGDLPAWQSESLLAITKVEYGMSKLDERAETLEAVKKLLAATGSPSPASLPGCLCELPTFGCKRVQIAGQPATIICFKLEGHKEAHLLVMDSKALPDAPAKNEPHYRKSKQWNLASWSDGTQTYLLATTADEAALRKLLAVV
jgi:hypothetical protein